jgi:hypothetical protein
VNKAPLCVSPAAVAAFHGWEGRLVALGVELNEVDRYVVGVVSGRQAILEELEARLVRVLKKQSERLRLVEAIRKASLSFERGVDLLERTFGQRVAEAVSVPEQLVASSGTGGRVLTIPARAAMGVAPRCRGAVAIRQRILGALAQAQLPLSKDQLRGRVRGDEGAFLRVLGELVREGAVRKGGRGRKTDPYTYAPGRQR